MIDISRFGRASRKSPCLVYPLKNSWGYSLKVVVRECAKKVDEYFLPVTPVRFGMADDGKEILVNTLGRWAFGVPGYMGHCLFEGGVKDSIKIYVPAKIPELVKMFDEAISMLEVVK